MSPRFVAKGRRWYGWTPEQAQAEWDKAVRDSNVPRQTDQFGNLCLAKLSTAVLEDGVRVGNKRAVANTNHFDAGDQDAIVDAKDSQDLSSAYQLQIVSARFVAIAAGRRSRAASC